MDRPFELFESLRTPTEINGRETFSAVRLSDRVDAYIGKDINSQPALLIRLEPCSNISAHPPIALEHLKVDYDVSCLVEDPQNGSLQEMFCILRCIRANRVMQGYFLEVVVAAFSSLATHPSRTQVSEVINGLAELFQSLSMPPRKSIQGLWAELLLIALSQSPRDMMLAWHRLPEDRFDFACALERVEVKSASGARRIHHFSYEQTCPPSDFRVILASILVRPSEHGANVFDLMEMALARVGHSPQLVSLTMRTVALTLGTNWQRASAVRFRFREAAGSLKYYLPDNMPRITCELPHGVSLVHFQSDLSLAQTIAIENLANRGQLFLALGKA